jgi:hypothetical protein
MQDVIAKFLSDDVKITKIKDHSTAGTDAVTSDELDMAGYDSVMFLTSFDTAAANNLITLHQSLASAGEAASVATVASDASSTEDVVLDVLWNPAYRYAKLVATRGTSSTLESMWAIQYNAHSKPQDNSTAGTIVTATFTCPALA